jgi:hypothetical protein
MTVFGFGRDGLKKFMTGTPNRFTIGLAEDADSPTPREAMNSACRDLVTPGTGVGMIERRTGLR